MRKGSGRAGEVAVTAGLAVTVLVAVILAAAFYFGRAVRENGKSSGEGDVTSVSDSSGEPSADPDSEKDLAKGTESTQEPEGSGDTSELTKNPEGSGDTPETTENPEEPGDASESTKEPEPTPEPGGSRAELLLENMSTREKVYQLFMVFPSAVTGVSPVTRAGDLTRKGLADYPVGGFIYDRTNMVSKEQVTEMLTTVQTCAKIPLLLACDEEGGRVNRLMGTVGTTYIDSMLSYKDQGREKAAENARIIAGDMQSCGFNTDFAPVADVWSNPSNTVIGDRAYSDDFAQAADLVAAAVEGFHGGGVACTLKHFPGHGDTEADSHTGAAYVTKTLEELKAGELLPFQAGIDAGADLVMIGHLTLTEVEEVPALFSYRIVTQLLREEMGFDGVVITDSLQMKAVTEAYGSGQAAVLAVQAGVDILLCPADLEEAANALIDAVETGVISEERLNESVLRILRLKEERGILGGAGS